MRRLGCLLCCHSLASHPFSQAPLLPFSAWDSESHSSSPAETRGSANKGPWEGREGSRRDKGCFPSSLLLFCFLFLALLACLSVWLPAAPILPMTMIYTFCTVPQPSALCPFTYPSYGLWSCPTKGLCSKPTQYLRVMAEVEMTHQHPILRGLSPGCVSNPSMQLAFKKPNLFLLSPKFCRRWVKIFYLLLKVSGSLLPTVYILSLARIIAVVSTLNWMLNMYLCQQ